MVPILPAVAHLAWLGACMPAYLRFRRALHCPARAQERVLARIVGSNADTDFGRMHDFAGITSAKEFMSRVPIRDYDEFSPFVDRIAAGECDVLTRDTVVCLEPTSGSTSAAKLIPYTSTLQREYMRAIGPWIADTSLRNPRVPLGPSYWSVSPSLPEKTAVSAVPVGFEDDSSYLGGNCKRLVDASLAVPSSVRHIHDVDSFRYATVLCMLEASGLGFISVWHPSFLDLVLDDLVRFWPSLVADVGGGTFTPPGLVPSHVARDVRMRLRASPALARRLERLDPRRPLAIWPHLRVVSCWADAEASRPACMLGKRLPGTKIQGKGLLATEGIVTIPWAGMHPVAVLSHFCEFLADDGTVFGVHELEHGREYSVLITTGGGLYRYRIGDRVCVDGSVSKTPSLRFIGREGGMSDVRGEKLGERFVADAIRQTLDRGRPSASFAMLAPDMSWGQHHYTLFIEPDRDAVVDERTARALDEALKENPHYRLCRRLGQLAEVRLFLVRRDAYEAYSGRCCQLGQRLGDVKPRALSKCRGWSECFDGAYFCDEAAA